MKLSQIKIRSTLIATYTIRTVLAVQILYAVGILAGGEQKWVQENFSILREFPGAPYSFGWILLTSVLIALSGSVLARRWKYSMTIRNIGLFAIGAWWFTFMISIASATTVDNRVPYTATISCLLPIGICAWLALIDERNPIADYEIFANPPLENGVPPEGPFDQEKLTEALRVLDDGQGPVPLLPPGSQRSQRLPGTDPAPEPGSDHIRTSTDPRKSGERSLDR